MEIKCSIQQYDLDTKVGRIRKFGGDRISANFSKLPNKQVAKMMSLDSVIVKGVYDKNVFIVEEIQNA